MTFKKPGAGAGGAAATQAQALIGAALQQLKFEFVQPPKGKAGGDQEFKVTRATHRNIRQLGSFWLLADGTLTFTKPKEIGAAKT